MVANTGLTVSKVLALGINPSNPQIVYAGTSGGGMYSITFVPPALAAIGDRAVVAGNTFTVVLSATDAGGDTLIFSVSGDPVGSSLTDSTFTWIPLAEQVGDHVVTFTVDDGRGETDSETITITVVPTFVVPLSPGLNLISLGAQSANDSITTLMAPLVGNLLRVIGFETDAINPNPPEKGGKLYNPSLQPFTNTLKLTDYHLAYWVVMSETDTLITRNVPAKTVSSAATGSGGLHPVYDFMGIHGELRVDGQPAPIGTMVQVIDGEGTLAGRSEVHHEGYYGFMPIYRDDAGTLVDEGADTGEWLTIQVNGQPAAQRVQWTTFGDEVKLDLEARSQPISPLPREFDLRHNYPNPFNPSTTISYRLPHEEQVLLSIWNLAGQLVRELVHAPQAAGHYSVTWDGRDEVGSLVANGVYLYQIRAGDFRMARKMVLMK